MKKQIRDLLSRENTKQNIILTMILVFFCIIFFIIEPKFLATPNIMQFSKQLPFLGLISLGILMLIITGNVDLSIGSVAAACGVFAIYLSASLNLHPLLVIPATLALGSSLGFMNGFLISKFKLQPFILTLGTNFFIRGTLQFITSGQPISGTPDWFYKIANTHIVGPLYSNTMIFIVIMFIVAFILNKTRFGRYSFAVGNNPEAARFSGISVEKQIVKVYMIEGAIAAIAGILIMSQINVGSPNEANGIDLYGLAAIIIGGAQFSGGVGTVTGAVIGVFIIKTIESGLGIIGANTFLQQAVIGGIIAFAIIVDSIRSNNIKLFTIKK